MRFKGGTLLSNPVIDAMMSRASVRSYTEEIPSEEVLETIVRAGQQAPFAAQMGTLILSRERSKNPFAAPLLFTVCADVHRLECVMKRRGWDRVASDGAILVFAIQDATYMAQNMVIAAESLGLGSCYLGAAPFMARRLVERYRLPPHVYPVVQLAMGYPAETPAPRPRYPVAFTLFEDRYPPFEERDVEEAMQVMDEGYLSQDYYRDFRVPLEEGRRETFTRETYSWTEHMGRKWGQWLKDPAEFSEGLEACGFSLSTGKESPSE
jgi:nitroreductase